MALLAIGRQVWICRVLAAALHAAPKEIEAREISLPVCNILHPNLIVARDQDEPVRRRSRDSSLEQVKQVIITRQTVYFPWSHEELAKILQKIETLRLDVSSALKEEMGLE